jgi:poly(3-hydroxybutyrate) depolymerase
MKATHKLVASVGAVVLGLTTMATSAATATAGGPEVFTESYSEQSFECGYPVDIAGEFTYTVATRTHSQKEPDVFYWHQSFSFREVWTNPETDEWFVVRGNSVGIDLTATHVEDNVYEFRQVEAGQPYVVEDSTGRVVARDRGVLRYRVQFDTGGDDDPGDQFVDFLGVEVGGPHPGFETDTCTYASDLLGVNPSTSSERYSLHPAGSTGSPVGYAAYVPPTYGHDPSPLLVFLHGSGESGDGSADALALQAEQAIPRYIATDGWPDERPFVVLAPQHEDTADGSDYEHCDGVDFPGSCFIRTWHDLGHPDEAGCPTPDEVRDFIAYAVATYDVDPSRVYLTGLSCGGFGVWEYLEFYGGTQVAAAIPIAAEGRPAWDGAGCNLASVPIWAFHGALDDLVDPEGAIVPMTNLRNVCGVANEEAGLTVYPDRDHDSWNITYAVGGPFDIYSWLLAHTSP